VTFRQKLVAGLAAVSVIALFAGFVAFPEWAAFVLQLMGMA